MVPQHDGKDLVSLSQHCLQGLEQSHIQQGISNYLLNDGITHITNSKSDALQSYHLLIVN